MRRLSVIMVPRSRAFRPLPGAWVDAAGEQRADHYVSRRTESRGGRPVLSIADNSEPVPTAIEPALPPACNLKFDSGR